MSVLRASSQQVYYYLPNRVGASQHTHSTGQ